MLRAQVGHRIEAVAAPGMAAAKSRKREPAAPPHSVHQDGLARIIRTGRQVPAIHADQRRHRPAVKGDQTKKRRLCHSAAEGHGYRSPFWRVKMKRPPSWRPPRSMSL